MNLTRRSVLAAGIASVGAAGCSGTDDGPARAAAKNGPEAAVRNLLAAIDAGNENRIDELTLEDNPEIEQQSVTVKMATVHSAERCATHYGEESKQFASG